MVLPHILPPANARLSLDACYQPTFLINPQVFIMMFGQKSLVESRGSVCCFGSHSCSRKPHSPKSNCLVLCSITRAGEADCCTRVKTMQEEVVLRDWEEAGDWLGRREGRMGRDGSWRGVQNHSLDVCEITPTVRPHRQNRHQEGEGCTVQQGLTTLSHTVSACVDPQKPQNTSR